MSIISEFNPKKDILYIDEKNSLHREERGLWFLGRVYRILTILFTNRTYDLKSIINNVENNPESIAILKKCILSINKPQKKEELQTLFNAKFPPAPINEKSTTTSANSEINPKTTNILDPSSLTTPQETPPQQNETTPEKAFFEKPNFLESSSKEDLDEYIKVLRSSLPQTRDDLQAALDIYYARFFKILFLQNVCYPIYITKKWDDSFISKNQPLKIFLEEASRLQLKKLLDGLCEKESQIESSIFLFNKALIEAKIQNLQE
jgi:hypothetical protein